MSTSKSRPASSLSTSFPVSQTPRMKLKTPLR